MKLIKKTQNLLGRIPLKFSVWIYFMGFTVLVFVLLWLFQILFLEKFYSQSKIHDVDAAATQIIKSFDVDPKSEFSDKLAKIASENDLCIEVVDRYGRSLYTKEYSVGCIIHGKENGTYYYLKRITDNGNKPIWLKVNNPNNNCSTVLYGCSLGSQDFPSGYLLINTALVPVGSTVSIIKRQLMFITGILIVLAFFISLFVAKRIAKPIDSITEAAENLAKGDFNTKFDGRGFLEVKKLADTLTYAEKELSRVDTMQRDLIANVSHDLRTPLTAICGYMDMLPKTDDKEKQAHYLEIMKERAEMMKQLTEELFRYSVILADEEEPECEKVFVNQVLVESISSFYPALTEKNIEPNINITEKRIEREINKKALTRVFSNLLNNAVKYSDGDLDITLTDAGEILFVNTAKELSTVDVGKLFDRFYTVEAAHNSTGLGLSIARTFIERMGGSITARYEEGRLLIKIVL